MQDKERMESLIRASNTNWTVVRPARIITGPHTGDYRSGTALRLGSMAKISFADLASFMLSLARTINFDAPKYGTFAEIGAGQEVAREFFQAGGASGTIAKSTAAYDMVFSDTIYGKAPRYVPRPLSPAVAYFLVRRQVLWKSSRQSDPRRPEFQDVDIHRFCVHPRSRSSRGRVHRPSRA
jgi:hypothetical protein